MFHAGRLQKAEFPTNFQLTAETVEKYLIREVVNLLGDLRPQVFLDAGANGGNLILRDVAWNGDVAGEIEADVHHLVKSLHPLQDPAVDRRRDAELRKLFVQRSLNDEPVPDGLGGEIDDSSWGW